MSDLPKHLILHRSESEVLYARVEDSTATFIPLPNNDVKQMRDAFIWGVSNGAVTWEMLD